MGKYVNDKYCIKCTAEVDMIGWFKEPWHFKYSKIEATCSGKVGSVSSLGCRVPPSTEPLSETRAAQMMQLAQVLVYSTLH